jgi:cytochrome c
MADNFNTIAGWTLGSAIVALGLASISGHHFRADKENRPETMGYKISGVVADGEGAVAEVPIETLLATADAAKGEETFKKCVSCHSIASGGANGIGPNLYAVLGDGVGTGRGGFAFTDGLKKHGGKWDFKTMNIWLKDPRGMAEGTKMTFAGLESGEDRANVIAYINEQGSNLPLPAAPAAAPAAAAKP